MNLREISDDFFTIGNIAILDRKTHNDTYDFDFRNYYDCRSVVSENDAPVLLHIGAIDDYAGIAAEMNKLGMKLLIPETEHLRCSTIEKWYPSLKAKTPLTKIYDTLPELSDLLEDFSFPVFIKGNRQTNRHKKSHCIIEDAEAYEALRKEWKNDVILSWQKAAVREFVPLQTVDSTSFPDMVPISYEFRFFYFEGKCMGYGPYWNFGRSYSMNAEDFAEAAALADWAAERMAVTFLAIDLAKTAAGEWIIIEVNDAQESGMNGVDPMILWKNTIQAAQEINWIPVDDLIAQGTVVLCGDPLPNMTIEMANAAYDSPSSEKDTADLYAIVHNKYWYIEDDLYDYEAGSEEYNALAAVVDAWGDLMHKLEGRIKDILRPEYEKRNEAMPETVMIRVYGPFMERNGYRDGRGWWIKK